MAKEGGSRKLADDRYTSEEAQQRFEAALRAGLNMPPKPHSEMKLGKTRGKRGKSPAKPKVKKRD
jgi:hypothetical protein